MPETNIELMQEIAKIQQNQALQGQLLQQISQNLSLNTQASTQQGAQIATLVTDVTVIKNEFATWRNEISSINAWRAESHTLFIPREEHKAARHEDRITALEQEALEQAKQKTQDVQKTADTHHSFVQWIVNNGVTILFSLIMLTLSLINLLKR